MMKKIYTLFIVLLVCLGMSFSSYGQHECDSSVIDPLDPLYCEVPLDGNIVFLIIGGILLGLLKLQVKQKKEVF